MIYAETVCGLAAEIKPFHGDGFVEELENCIRGLIPGGVELVVSHFRLHDGPQSLDGVQVRVATVAFFTWRQDLLSDVSTRGTELRI